MSDRQQEILEAAIDVFSRYGVRKTTMGDIAEQARISRQTLYARYANKEEIIAAAMQLITDKVISDIADAWRSADTISEKLDIFLDIAVVRFFEQIRQMPDSRDLMTGHGEAAAAVDEAAAEAKIGLLADLFEARGAALTAHGSSARDLAEFVFSSSASFKFTAGDLDELKRLLATLKRTTMLMLGEG